MILFILWAAGNVAALPLTFEDEVTRIPWGADNVDYTHNIFDNITNEGYDPALLTLTGAHLDLTFVSLGRGDSTFSLMLDNTPAIEGNNPWSYIYRLRDYDVSMQLDDGMLNIALAQSSGGLLSGFHFVHSTLTAAYDGYLTEAVTPAPTPTPEPSSAILFGVGLLVLVGFIRRFAFTA